MIVAFRSKLSAGVLAMSIGSVYCACKDLISQPVLAKRSVGAVRTILTNLRFGLNLRPSLKAAAAIQ